VTKLFLLSVLMAGATKSAKVGRCCSASLQPLLVGQALALDQAGQGVHLSEDLRAATEAPRKIELGRAPEMAPESSTLLQQLGLRANEAGAPGPL